MKINKSKFDNEKFSKKLIKLINSVKLQKDLEVIKYLCQIKQYNGVVSLKDII